MNIDLIKMTVATKAFAVTLAAVAGAAAGAGTTFVVLHKTLQKKYADLADEEISEAKDALARRYKVESYSEPKDYGVTVNVQKPEDVSVEDVREAAQLISEQQKYVPYNLMHEKRPVQKEEERIEVVASQRRNVFEDNGIVEVDEFDQEEEDRKRDDGEPYILLDTVYYENKDGYQQFQFQYFEDDDVLVDENQSPIDKSVIDRNLGLDNLRFGYGSKNKNTVLIHNPNSGNQYEVIRSLSSYSKEILGFDPYEDARAEVRKFRNEE